MQKLTTLLFCPAFACIALSIVLSCIATYIYVKNKEITKFEESPFFNRFIAALSAAPWTDSAVRDRAIESIEAACQSSMDEEIFAQKMALFAVNHSLAGALRAAARLNPSKNFQQWLEQCACACEAGSAAACTDAEDSAEEVQESALAAALQAERTGQERSDFCNGSAG